MKIAIINPGTEPIMDASVEHAKDNMAAFADEVMERLQASGLKKDRYIGFHRQANKDYGEGRFAFHLVAISGGAGEHVAVVEIQMPGWPLANVRYVGGEDQNAWAFPRLYVDGSSWLWKFAVNMAVNRFAGGE